MSDNPFYRKKIDDRAYATRAFMATMTKMLRIYVPDRYTLRYTFRVSEKIDKL